MRKLQGVYNCFHSFAQTYILLTPVTGFRSLHWNFRKTYKRGEINSVETTQPARTEIRHDFLAHGELLRVSLYGRQG